MYKQKWNQLTEDEKEMVRMHAPDDREYTDEELEDHFNDDPDQYEIVELNPENIDKDGDAFTEYLKNTGDMESYNEAERAAAVILDNREYIIEYLLGPKADRTYDEGAEGTPDLNCWVCKKPLDWDETNDRWSCPNEDCNSHLGD